MLTTNTQFEIELKKLVAQQIMDLSETMAHGNAPDFAAYQRQAGIIAGLRLVDELCDEATKIINER